MFYSVFLIMSLYLCYPLFILYIFFNDQTIVICDMNIVRVSFSNSYHPTVRLVLFF